MTGKEWKTRIEKLDNRFLMELELSLRTILKWGTLKTEYHGLGLETVLALLQDELRTREIPLNDVVMILNKKS